MTLAFMENQIWTFHFIYLAISFLNIFPCCDTIFFKIVVFIGFCHDKCDMRSAPSKYEFGCNKAVQTRL